MKFDKSRELFKNAVNLIPGGVNSPVRACQAVDTEPLFIERAEGCFIYDTDGNRFIDYVGSWGPLILGHRNSGVIRALSHVLNRGISFGAPTDLEVKIAEIIINAVPSVEMVRMVNSGTEATMSAIRLARAYTKRDTIIKFDGCYHGHADSLLVAAGSGVATLGIPGSPGIPDAFVKHTLSLPYNDIEQIKSVMDERGDEIACIIVEPVAGNMGLVMPVPDFLNTLRNETEKHGALLIFDEVMTGFRVAYGGAQERFKITPDLTCLGKIIGGGLPVGAYGGRKEIMSQIAPRGDIYQAGTLSGNPVAMAAGIATLEQLRLPGTYERLEERSGRLANGIRKAAEKVGIPIFVERIGSMIGVFFTDGKIKNFDDAKKSDLNRFSSFYNEMRRRGIYLPPSQFEVIFVCSAHEHKHIETTLEAAGEVFDLLANPST